MSPQPAVQRRVNPQVRGGGRQRPAPRVTRMRRWVPGLVGTGVALLIVMFLVTRATSGVQSGSFVGGDLHSLLVVPDGPSTVFVGGHQSAAVSRDGGRTFQQLSGLQNYDNMAWSMSDDGRHQVVSGHGGLRTTDDAGATWTDRSGQLPGSDVHAVGMDASAPSRLWAYVVGTGVLSSMDDGQSWAVAGGVDLQLIGPILVRDGGSTLTAIGMMRGLVVSHDRGKTWQTVDPGFQQMWVAVDPKAPQHLVAAGNGVISSTDGGASWTGVGNAPAGAMAVAMSMGPHPAWFAAVLNGDHATVFRSDDAGATWQQMTRS